MVKNQIQELIKEKLLPLSDTILDCSIRVGKTKIALDLLEDGESVLWVYPRTFMMDGYKEDIQKFPPKTDNITFTTTSSLKKYQNQNFDRIIVDEPQDLSPAQIKYLKTIRFKKRLGLSGSLSSKTKLNLELNLNWKSHVIYSLEDAIKDKLVKNYNIYIHMMDMDDNTKNVEYKKFGKTVKGTEKEAYLNLSATVDYFSNLVEEYTLSGNQSQAVKSKLGERKYVRLRTELIYNSQTLFNYATKLIDHLSSKKLLIYTLRTDIADILGNTSFHTKNRDKEMLEWFKKSDTGCMATVNCITTGITIKNLNTVIFHAFESNSETFLQKLGRSLYYDENEQQASNIHVCVLKNTQAEKWIENACGILDQRNIYYIYKGKKYSKIEWLNYKFPDKQIFQIKENETYIIGSKTSEGQMEYFFPTNPSKRYNFSPSKVKLIE